MGALYQPGRAYTGILNLLYPPVCPFCGEILTRDERIKDAAGAGSAESFRADGADLLSGICFSCRKKIIRVREPACMHCGCPLPDDTQEYCTQCARVNSAVRRGKSLWLHKDPVPGALYRLKYHNKKNIGTLFGRMLSEAFARELKAWDIQRIYPIPLHAEKLRARGYNQAEVIARALSQSAGIPMDSDVLLRIRNTAALKDFEHKERRAALMGAFAVSVREPLPQNVLLVDDIYTTGSTMEAAARVLKKAGAENIYFLTVSIGQGK